jgi:hypothetical protein
LLVALTFAPPPVALIAAVKCWISSGTWKISIAGWTTNVVLGLWLRLYPKRCEDSTGPSKNSRKRNAENAKITEAIVSSVVPLTSYGRKAGEKT